MKTVLRLLATASAMAFASSAAMAAGELNVYNWGNYTSPEMIKKFEEKYDVKVNLDTATIPTRRCSPRSRRATPAMTSSFPATT
jgi:spermidine/putrescine-binding protein